MQLPATGYWLSVPNKSNTKNKAKDRYLPLIHADDADFTARSPRQAAHPSQKTAKDGAPATGSCGLGEVPREIEGGQALFVVNLEPRKMRGVVSEGMLFDIGFAGGITPVLAIPENSVPDGSRAG